jgi:hypothetical protein
MFYNTRKFFLLITSLSFAASSIAEQNSVLPFEATYAIKYHGIAFATATRTFQTDQSGHYTFTFYTHSTFPLANFKIFETSQGKWTTKGPRPLEYSYHHQGMLDKRNIISQFNWAKHMNFSNKNDREYQINIPNDAHDKLSYQLALRQDLIQGKKTFVYNLANKGHISTYIFKKFSEETLQIQSVNIKTIKMQRTNSSPHREVITFWLAPEYDYVPVKIIGVKDGKVIAEAEIRTYKALE